MPLLGTSGELAHVSYRLDNGGTNGSLEVKVIDGAYNAETITSAEIAAIPDEDVVYHENAIVLANSATVSTKTNIVNSVSEAALYDRRGGSGYSNEDRTVMLVWKGDGTLAGSLYITFRALNVGR
jgi:hypothetical protein